ncbi:MAG: class II glutamine amidotransferase, partial [Hyphomicrobium sp.]|nr:class II glutamine amidotransferase [Hyphomicrobium sp.]
MCGIVGIIGQKAVATDLVDALRRLEYRGYDSAGIATVENGHLERRRAEGKLRNLEGRLLQEPLRGHTGIGHTRWATHGRPTERNAHPHMNSQVSVVHNGIIENFRELKAELGAKGYVFESDTDTEAIVAVVADELSRGVGPEEAVRHALGRLQGAFALAIIFAGHDDLMIAARQGSPLAIGHGTGEMYLGSDAIALAPFTDAITYLDEGDWAVLRHNGVEIFDRSGRLVERPQIKSVASSLLVDKGNHRHFMAKEIHEQPEVISH